MRLLKKNLDKIAEDLRYIKKRGFWAVLYGSIVRGDFTSRSDIDVAVITKVRDKKENIRIWWDLVKNTPEPYDIRIFELMPLYIKAEVFDNYIVLYGDELEISEYFYFYRKIWKDQVHRIKENQFTSMKEKLAALRRYYRMKKSE